LFRGSTSRRRRRIQNTCAPQTSLSFRGWWSVARRWRRRPTPIVRINAVDVAKAVFEKKRDGRTRTKTMKTTDGVFSNVLVAGHLKRFRVWKYRVDVCGELGNSTDIFTVRCRLTGRFRFSDNNALILLSRRKITTV